MPRWPRSREDFAPDAFTPRTLAHRPRAGDRAPEALAAATPTHHADLSDAELLAAHRAGERGAFEGLVDRHGPALWAALLHATRDAERARELFQETWLRALENIDRVRQPEQLRSWLVSVGLNALRQELRRPSLFEGELEEIGLVEAEQAAAEQVEQRDLCRELEREIARLPERQRAVLELRLKAELSHADVARALGIREDNARAHLYQALRTLRARAARWFE